MWTRLALIVGTLWSVSSGTFGKDDALPRQNLLVELRWVAPAPASAAADRVVSTSAGPESGSTPPRRVIVANGGSATIMLAEPAPPARQAEPAIGVLVQPPAPRSGAGPSAKGSTALPQPSVTPIITLAPTAPREVAARPYGTSVHVRWPGGHAPARVDLHDATPGQGEIETSLDVQIDRWTTLTPAMPAPATAPNGATVIGTRHAEAARARELQIRVSAAP